MCLLLSELVSEGDLVMPGQRVIALVLLHQLNNEQCNNMYSEVFLKLLKGEAGGLPLTPQERLLIGILSGFVNVKLKEVSGILYKFNYSPYLSIFFISHIDTVRQLYILRKDKVMHH